MVPEIWCTTDGRMDDRTDEQKKWHIEVGAPPKNPETSMEYIIKVWLTSAEKSMKEMEQKQ